MLRSVLTVFFDGLKPESLQHMPFLSSFPNKERMKTLLGYSVACHASMYTGVWPNKHELWFIWKYSPKTSPFSWTKPFKNIRVIDNLLSRYFFHKTTTLFEKNTSCFGIPLVVNLPLRYWPYFDVSEKKLWNEPNYLETYPTIFDILRDNKIEFEIVGMEKGVDGTSKLVQQHTFSDVKPWTYLFIGDVDGLSHHLQQDSPEVIRRLRELDRIVEAKYREFMTKVEDFDFICFSDHGHIKVENRIDLYSFFSSHGENLNDYLHVIDGNYARFWFRNIAEERIVREILSQSNEGLTLTGEDLKKYHVNMPDNRYGDLVFYLDAPNIFSKTIWGFGRKQRSMHGYLPDHRDSDGIFISNIEIKDINYVNLIDILPSILTLLELPIPDYIDGQALWR